jgi:P-type Mg2+ transporter
MPRSAGQPLTRSTVKVAPSAASGTDLVTAATLDATAVLAALGTGPDGPTPAEANRRRAEDGPNAVRTRHARALGVLGHQLRSALLVLLLVTAVVSYVLGERTEALIIGTILAASIGLRFANEYRAERAAEALHSSMRHLVTAIRGGAPVELDVTGLVPGDVVLLQLGAVVPADIRLLEVSGLECDESVLTGESDPAVKDPVPVPASTALADLSSCALMGTVVRAGSGRGVVVATGGRAEFSRIALGLGERQPETEFQVGLRRFSMLLLQVAVALTA